jgi:hypothetical protein
MEYNIEKYLTKKIRINNRKDGLEFLVDTIQGGRKRPQKYRHFIQIPMGLFNELTDNKIIIIEDYWCEMSAYFEYYETFIRISFINYCHIEDLHVRILDYLVRKFNDNENPIIRGAHSKL